MSLLEIKQLGAEVGGKQVLHEVELRLEEGEVAALTGPNGGGKSSLAQVLMGNSEYKVRQDPRTTVMFAGKDLLAMTIDERARAGLYVGWQNPPALPGVKVFNLIKHAVEALWPIRQAQDKQAPSRGGQAGKPGIESVVEFKRQLEKLAIRVGLTKQHVGRSVNEGFSGGERKRLELLQLLVLQPQLAILDEVDSGLDQEGRELVVAIVKEMRARGTSFVIISHYEKTLLEMEIDTHWVMRRGKLEQKA